MGKTHEPTVLIGVTGCIAAYKACELTRALQKAGARVKVVMTEHATHFVGPATFKALTGEPVAIDLIDGPGEPIHHISLAQEADVFCVAPATANVINKLAAGIADDLLTTTALACAAPLLVAPAMNTHMWRDPATQAALATLRSHGAIIVEPEAGYLACGDTGEGRLASVDKIAAAALEELRRSRDLTGATLLVTAGPTREPVDSVRYLSSPASGLTGYRIAEEAARRGAQVTLVSGPTTLPDPFDVRTVRVQTATEMLDAATEAFATADAAVFTAAVADFRPAHPAAHKLKKGRDLPAGGTTTLELVANPDILATLAAHKGARYVVGFAAETEDVVANAQAKLAAKGADLIVANDVSNPELGFASADNRVWFVAAAGVEDSGLIPKTRLAGLIVNRVAAHLRRG